MTIVRSAILLRSVFFSLSLIVAQTQAFLAVPGGEKKRYYSTTTTATALLGSQPPNGSFDDQRRSFLEWTLSSPLLVAFTNKNEAVVAEGALPSSNSNKYFREVTMPLSFNPRLNAYIVCFTLFKDEPERFCAVLDTGSPFLTVPSYCNRSKSGCYRPELTDDSGYSSTVERFDNNEGTVVWRRSQFSFWNATTPSNSGSTVERPPPYRDIVFGVLDERLMDGPGGVFLGLIKKTEKRIRPSFLGQLGVRAFAIDLRAEEGGRSLTLATEPMIDADAEGYIPLVTDLNRRYRDPVGHYTAIADGVIVNGAPLRPAGFRNGPTYVIFDTGVTGMVVSQELFDERYTAARNNREKSLWGSVEIFFRTKGGERVSLQATKPITTPLGQTPWPGFNANLIVVGLAFLDDHIITVDIDDQKLQID